MEATEITCPQCGLVNNYLADACVQCGIIFVKNPAMLQAAQTVQDQENRKTTEAAEAGAYQTQPSNQTDASDNEPIKRPDPHEDTVEMVVPAEEDTPQIVAKPSDSMENAPEDNKKTENAEIEMEAIETSMEAVTEPTDAETLFLTEVDADQSAEQAAAGPFVEPADTPAEPQKAADQSPETDKSGSAGENSHDTDAKDAAAKQPEAQPMAATSTPESSITHESEDTKTETVASVETSAPAQKSDVPAESDIPAEERFETAPVEQGAAQADGRADAKALIEAPEKKADIDARAKEEAQKAKNEALKKQLEAQAKVEARKKEEAAMAKAVALKKKKRAQAKAEALMKQKDAQAKAEAKNKAAHDRALAEKKHRADQTQPEALKKQKEAQAKVETSAREMQVASGTQPAALHATGKGLDNHARLLELLKRYQGKAIGINYDNSAEIKEAELVEANEEFFSIRVKDKELQFSYPLKTILTIIEGQHGVETGEADKKSKFDAVIKVYPLVLF